MEADGKREQIKAEREYPEEWDNSHFLTDLVGYSQKKSGTAEGQTEPDGKSGYVRAEFGRISNLFI